MIVRTTAIPFAYYPYSSTSAIVHWFSRTHGKISTILKGAYRLKSPFLGEHDLFSTSELLFFTKRTETLYAGKECSILHRRDAFRNDWRAMQTASYISTLFSRTLPENAPHPELFSFYEELLDGATEFGRHPQFLLWAELCFAKQLGHTPHFDGCLFCSKKENLTFCSEQGGIVCIPCAQNKKLNTLEISQDVIAIFKALLQAQHPSKVLHTRLIGKQLSTMHAISSTFICSHFDIQSAQRNAALAT